MPRLRRRRVRPRGDDDGGVDRLSSLPDDLLRLILRRLDTRTALSTAVLGRRWARLPRDLPSLDLRVGDVLPPRYHRALAIRRGCHPGHSTASKAVRKLDAVIAQCERRATRAFAHGVTGLLEAAGADEGDDRRRAKTLRLEFFLTGEESGCAVVDRLIPAAIGAWGVEDLEVVARRPPLLDDGLAAGYTFPHHLLDDELHRSRLRRLTLANCTASPPPPHRYAALAELVLRDMPASTPLATYRALFTARSPLQVLHLISCRCAGKERRLVISAPHSQLRELVVDGCSFLAIDLRALPALERLACLTNTVELRYGAVPRLTHVTLAFSSEKSAWEHDELDRFLDGASAVESLVVRLTRPSRWIVARPPETRLRGLTRLLVADVPASWDVTWPRLLLLAAPYLETLHIHVARHKSEDEKGREISWNLLPSRKFRHRRLKEVVVAGFGRTWRQIFFVRYLARVCKRLHRVFLFYNWCVQETGLWDWDLKQQSDCPWSEEDKMVIRKQIKYGKAWCRPQLQVIVR
ncbi:hypothetical protein EJB05_37288, partial [Eragrostis curvula]